MAGKKGQVVQLQTEVNTEEEWQALLEKEGLTGEKNEETGTCLVLSHLPWQKLNLWLWWLLAKLTITSLLFGAEVTWTEKNYAIYLRVDDCSGCCRYKYLHLFDVTPSSRQNCKFYHDHPQLNLMAIRSLNPGLIYGLRAFILGSEHFPRVRLPFIPTMMVSRS